MKKITFGIIMLSALVLLVACLETSPSTEVKVEVEELASEEPYSYYPTLSPIPDWVLLWLNEPVCQPPCWENITPEETSYTDALTIANTISGFGVSYVGDDNIRLVSNQDNTYNSVILSTRDDVNIQEIYLNTGFTLLELGDIVDVYGFPDEMLDITSFDRHFVDLLYYDLGMVITFELLPSDPRNKVNLSHNINVRGISFYAPQLEYYFNLPLQYGISTSPAIKLKGYGVYDIPYYE